MTDLPSPAASSANGEDELPIALRRVRRSCSNHNLQRDSQPKPSKRSNHIFGIETPPATPQRTKKRVRFSDPGPAISATGLTPFISRNLSISTPSSKRRHSSSGTRWNLALDDTPISGTLQFAPLRQVLEGRVKRRLRRNRLSEEVNTIEWEQRQEKKAEKAEIARLQDALRRKDLELQYLREEHETASQLGGEPLTPTSQVHDLEAQVAELKAELERRESVGLGQDDPNWTMAARDPFDADAFMQDYDDDFDDGMTEMLVSTPLRRSFPSPPATVSNTPSKSPPNHNIGVQASGLDPAKRLLEEQLETLQSELGDLTKSVEQSNTTHERLSAKLAAFIPPVDDCPDESLDFALDSVLTHLALAQSSAIESENRFSALTTELHSIFPTSSTPSGATAEVVIQTLHDQFRSARLELEHLLPGEQSQGFDNTALLSMLLTRLRTHVERVKRQDDEIDQYHEQEVSLRSQLSARVDAMRGLQEKLTSAEVIIRTLEREVGDKDESLRKLTAALESYRTEISSLETLISRLDVEHTATLESAKTQLENMYNAALERIQGEMGKTEMVQAESELQQSLITELDARLTSAIAAADNLRNQLQQLAAEREAAAHQVSNIQGLAGQREHEHGSALALRDACVAELRGELEHVNAALKGAYDDIITLKLAVQEGEGAAERERQRGKERVEGIKGELRRVLEMAAGGTPKKGEASGGGRRQAGLDMEGVVMQRSGGLFDGQAARRRAASVGSGEEARAPKRRKYDSGLGSVDEEVL